MNTIQRIVLASLVALTATSATSVWAAETDIQVDASISPSCTIISADDQNFGQLDPSNAIDKSLVGFVVFSCTKGVNWTLTPNNGQNYDSATGRRRMVNGSNYLPYYLNNYGTSAAGVGEGYGTQTYAAYFTTVLGQDYRDVPALTYRDTVGFTLLP